MQDLLSWRKQFAPEVVGEAQQFLHALTSLQRVATSDATVILSGETGTGKELFAKAAHRASFRAAKPFIPVNCATVQDSLFETELFGHVRGAFTGATQARAGRFQAANGGTLFLDEIGELSPAAQAKLLRVLEDHEVIPVGSDVGIPTDVRIIVATHRDLEDMVADGRFRGDLYYRLAVVPIELPALRDRGDDIDRITDVAIAKLCERSGKSVAGIEKDARAKIRAYPWPGNIRELWHCLERSVLLSSSGPLSAADVRVPSRRAPCAAAPPCAAAHGDLFATTMPASAVFSEVLDARAPMVRKPQTSPPTSVGESESLDLRSALESTERRYINHALDVAGGNRTEAAALLGLNRTTLVEKLRKYGV
jgi:transcriptional regulator with GAF, ATPase, and Fis domain